MNSIATRNRTEFSAAVPWLDALRSVLPVVVLCVLWIGFQPFQGARTEAFESSLLNQLGYTAVAALCLTVLLTSVDRHVTTALVSLPWVVLFIGLILSGQMSPAPEDARRAIAFSLIVTVVAASLLALPPGVDAFSKALRLACFAVLGLCYFGVIAMPIAAIHQASEVESQHSGLWRGLYIHKNVAGPIMATMLFAGIYLMRRNMKISGIIIGVLAMFFIAKTGSKTSLAVAPIVALIILLPALMGMRGLAALVVFIAAIATHALTIGTVYSPFLDAVLRAFDATTTFTGRVEIWEFSKPFLLDKPWTGYGYDGFWNTAITHGAERPFDLAWDPRDIIHGHNGFLDVALFMGLPMMLLLVWALLISPIRSYLKVPNLRENVLLADFLLMIIAFTLMNAALESFFFRRADPVWLTLVLAVFGMRIVSRFPVTSRG